MTEQTKLDMLEAALSYAHYGWSVLPVYDPLFDNEGTCIGCTCEEWHRQKEPEYICDSPGKHPRLKEWEEKATTDFDQIKKWWGWWPLANVGIAPGPSELVVVDEDTYNEIEEGSKLVLAEQKTVTSLTGGGGSHLIFKHPVVGPRISNSDSRLPGWVNIRAHGGQFIAPPSLHKSGKHYEWEPGYGPDDIEPAPLPGPLCELLQGPTIKKERAPAVEGDILAGKRHPTLVSFALAALGGFA